jgi:hypothetical protein
LLARRAAHHQTEKFRAVQVKETWPGSLGGGIGGKSKGENTVSFTEVVRSPRRVEALQFSLDRIARSLASVP